MSSYRLSNKVLKILTPSDCEAVLAELEQLNPAKLKRLSLAGHVISAEAAKIIAPKLSTFTKLKVLDISDIFATRSKEEVPIALTAIREALMPVQTYSHGNALGPSGMQSLVDIMLSHQSLRSFSVHNTGMSPMGAKHIAAALVGHLTTEVPPPFPEKSTPVVLSEVLSTLDKSKRTAALTEFVAGRSRVETGGVFALALAFAAMGTLVKIRMPQNGIRKKGMQMSRYAFSPLGMRLLADALQLNPWLEEIDFNDNNIGPAENGGPLAWANTIRALPRLRKVNLGDNILDKEGAIELIEALAERSTLEELCLSYSEIDDEVCDLIVEKVIARNPKLCKLDLNGNNLGVSSVKMLRVALAANGQDETALAPMPDNEGSYEEEDYDEEDEEEAAVDDGWDQSDESEDDVDMLTQELDSLSIRTQ